ncbi:MAG: Stf0 family sulfotransferase [Hyphomonas sp.]
MAAQTPSQSCIICSTPRTGSTLLCGLLASTGIAGQPQSYFRKEDAEKWAGRFGIPVGKDSAANFRAFLDGVLLAGTSPNGVFSVRIMWGSMEELTANLSTSNAAWSGTDEELLRQAFGPSHFIWLHRLDTLAQAISWARAEQTRIWHRLEGEPTAPAISPAYDFDQIHMLIETIRTHNEAWQAWFNQNGITPLSLTYEALDADAPATIRTVLDQLGLDTGKANEIRSRNIRLTDQLSLDWAEQYRRDLVRRESA